MPNVYEPPITIAKGGLSACITRVQDFGVAIGTTAVSDQATLTIPPDTDTTEERTGSGTAPTVGNAYGVWYDIAANNILCKNELKCATSSTNANTGTWTASYNVDVTPYVCFYNFAQKHLTEGLNTNTDVQFIVSTVSDLQADAGFRDPITIDAAAGGSGISDVDFDNYITAQPLGDYVALENTLTSFRNSFNAQGRTGRDNNDDGKGDAISISKGTWDAFDAELDTFKSYCERRVVEIDKRIGLPTRTGGGAGPNAFPTGRITAIPASPAEGELIPYARSIYNNVNYLLGQDINLLGGIIKDIESLTDLVDMVKTARNKYEIFSGRDKVYS